MADNIIPGPMSMIKIDGHKIKQLREQQGLTQLYLATAVDVTTDTISRWENKRYPSIKRENGLRLAEALSVTLEEILDTEEEADQEQEEPSQETSPAIEMPVTPAPRTVWPIVLLSSTLLVIILGFIYYYFSLVTPPVYKATRTSPPHFISGQPFPVVIEVTSDSEAESAFILKEQLIAGSEIVGESPETSGKDKEKGKLTWLAKMKTPSTFSYIVKVDAAPGSTREFEGSIATSGGNPIPVEGTTAIVSGVFHWADADKDNSISDREILTVYDKYSAIAGLASEIDMIEEIWLGEGYSWNPEDKTYEIID